jgi:hypothetical protein
MDASASTHDGAWTAEGGTRCATESAGTGTTEVTGRTAESGRKTAESRRGAGEPRRRSAERRRRATKSGRRPRGRTERERERVIRYAQRSGEKRARGEGHKGLPQHGLRPSFELSGPAATCGAAARIAWHQHRDLERRNLLSAGRVEFASGRPG